MTATLILRPQVPEATLAFQPSLEAVFLEVQAAVTDGRAIAIVVPSEHLLGARSPEGAAYVNALVGLARAVAFEGAKPGWRINVVAAPGADADDETVRGLTAAEGLSGQLLTLGTGLVGRITP
ncbi:hypothetical protein [Salinibacterium sp. ZJ454]|uniref:hypothetical protein n=1 Tax=Salinibacterium sp. ZJ454 TaxID=2708339 RepID=UPI001424085A|nr:hypothetical protein [Salinibacterium sp. ZJ454]